MLMISRVPFILIVTRPGIAHSTRSIVSNPFSAVTFNVPVTMTNTAALVFLAAIIVR